MHDIQNQADHRQIAIDKVGVKGGVKLGQCGGAKVGQLMGADVLEH
jgi:GTP cyclohydrolase FolE2